MAEQFMAHLGPSYVESNHLGENNAIKYMIQALGVNNDSSVRVPYVKINGVSVLPSYGRGLNAITISPTGVASNFATFDIYARPEHLDTLRTYLMSAPSDNIVVIVSSDAMKSSEDFDTFMKQYGAMSWPGSSYLNRQSDALFTPRAYRSSYVAIFNTTLKRFCYENFVGNNPNSFSENTNAYLQVVFDDVVDIGACGLPSRNVDNINEYFSVGNQYEFKRYLSENITTQWESIYHIQCELHSDQTLVTAGGRCIFYVWTRDSSGIWKNSIWLGTHTPTPGVWTKFEGYFKLPTQSSGAKIFASAAYRYPSSVSAGTAGVRNVTITRVTRDDDDKVADAAIGVNGIRANSISNNGNYANPVLQLLNLKPKNIITSNDFNER